MSPHLQRVVISQKEKKTPFFENCNSDKYMQKDCLKRNFAWPSHG